MGTLLECPLTSFGGAAAQLVDTLVKSKADITADQEVGWTVQG